MQATAQSPYLHADLPAMLRLSIRNHVLAGKATATSYAYLLPVAVHSHTSLRDVTHWHHLTLPVTLLTATRPVKAFPSLLISSTQQFTFSVPACSVPETGNSLRTDQAQYMRGS